MSKGLKQVIHKENIQMVRNTYMKTCSISQAIREVKTTRFLLPTYYSSYNE